MTAPAQTHALAAVACRGIRHGRAGRAGGLAQASGAAGRRPKAVALTSYAGVESEPSFSPDGTKVAFVWNGEKEDNDDIYVKQIGSAGHARAADHEPAERT